MDNYLNRKQDFVVTWEARFAKIWAWDRGFFNHMSRIWEILCLSSNYEITRRALSGISSKTRSCMITCSNQTIETVCLVVFFFGKKKGIRERDVQNCGMRDFHEKGVGIIIIILNSQYLSVSDLLRPLAYSSELTTQ